MMGCDIHSAVEVRDENGLWHWDNRRVFPGNYGEGQLTNCPFDWRGYGMFGFLADVRNYSFVPPLSEIRGLPENVSAELASEDDGYHLGGHSFSWLSLAELLNFDYDQTFEDRRTTKQLGPNFWSGAEDAGAGNGTKTTFREFLGSDFFRDLEILKQFGEPDNVRIVFGFDS